VKGAALVVLVLAVAARTKLTFTAFGSPVAMPVLWLIAAIVALALLAAVLWIVYRMLYDGVFLRPAVAS
jgi:hypothetical protein